MALFAWICVSVCGLGWSIRDRCWEENPPDALPVNLSLSLTVKLATTSNVPNSPPLSSNLSRSDLTTSLVSRAWKWLLCFLLWEHSSSRKTSPPLHSTEPSQLHQQLLSLSTD